MAYIPGSLRLIQHLGVVSFWHYITDDSHATVDTLDYFAPSSVADTRLHLGDMIMVEVVDDVDTPTSITDVGMHVVNALSTTSVDVTDVVDLMSGTDTD